MPRDLSDALQAAKTNRGVLSKLVIWESGVSKSQFYRIINGEEAPSLETKNKISKSLEINEAEFDGLYAASMGADSLEVTPAPVASKKQWMFGAFVIAGSIIAGSAIFAYGTQEPPMLPFEQSAKNADDATLFIADVTIPDGTTVKINTTYEKVWRVKNTGQVIWKDRYLKRITAQSDLVCSSPQMVPIPETRPGESVDISVTFTAPHIPGSCRTDWKSADRKGNLHFPEKHGLYSIVTVAAQ